MRSAADDVQMMYMPADDVHACGRCVDDVRMTYVIRQLKSHSCVIHTSSAHRLHIVHASYARDFSSQTISS